MIRKFKSGDQVEVIDTGRGYNAVQRILEEKEHPLAGMTKKLGYVHGIDVPQPIRGVIFTVIDYLDRPVGVNRYIIEDSRDGMVSLISESGIRKLTRNSVEDVD